MIDLMTFVSGMTNYIAAHNSNYTNIKSAIDALEAMIASASGGASSNPAVGFEALFGGAAVLIGSSSYASTQGSTSLTLSAGAVWKPSSDVVASSPDATVLSFSGRASGTYYIAVDGGGTPNINTVTSVDDIYRVVWSGTAFTSVTKLVNTFPNITDFLNALTSTALVGTYATLDARLEAGETKAVAGDLAQTWKKGGLSKAVSSGTVALTATEANNMVLEFTGALSADVNVTVPLSGGPRAWVVKNSTTGGYVLTIKGSAGNGVKIAKGSRVWVAHDGTNIVAIQSTPNTPAVMSVPYGAAMTLDFSYVDVIKSTLTGNAAITLSTAGVPDGHKCTLELTQDGTGSRTASFGSEVRLGSDLTLLTLSTTPNKTDKIGFIFDATAGKFDAVAMMKGY